MHQPFLHDLVTVVDAPGVVLGAPDGQIRDGAQGVYWSDRRLLSSLIVTAENREPIGVRSTAVAPGEVRFLGVLRELGDPGADPTVTVQRDRAVIDSGLAETITVHSAARVTVTTQLEVRAGCDLADMAQVKAGYSPAPLVAAALAGAMVWTGADDVTVRLIADPPPVLDGDMMTWAVTLDPGATFAVTLKAWLQSPTPPVMLATSGATGHTLTVRSGDQRFSRLVTQSVADVESLLLADPLSPFDAVLAAGAPWYLTLFGRDAIWAARMLLPQGTALAGSTLRTLARRQGTVVDADSAQEPGKIMHEIRAAEMTHDRANGGFRLPPLYYGTVDATPLWISLLHDAWRWGLPAAEVEALLPNVRRAMRWLIEYGANHAHGFVSYEDTSGHGLANQGWKDSRDSVQFRDGSLATPPIALCEVQGYAYAAARHAADLFDAFDQPGGSEWRRWADELAERFRAAFWVRDESGAYPAIALDASGRPADTVTSNMAHLLGTGLLRPAEELLVIDRLGGDDMDSGYGLRTLSASARGFNPLSYHLGSVWTHDTAIAITALTSSDAPAASPVAASLIEGLLAAAPAFDFRLPELFGGHARAAYPVAVPYPASCAPQAWSAAAAIALVTALLGIRPDVPGDTVRLRPLRPSPVGAFEVRGLRLGERTFDVTVDADGDPVVHGLDLAVTIE